MGKKKGFFDKDEFRFMGKDVILFKEKKVISRPQFERRVGREEEIKKREKEKGRRYARGEFFRKKARGGLDKPIGKRPTLFRGKSPLEEDYRNPYRPRGRSFNPYL